MVKNYWEDFKVGEQFTTRRITIMETHVVNFSHLTMQLHQLHTDLEYCKQTPFGRPIVNSPLTLSMAQGLINISGVWGNSVITVLGIDKVKLLSPVFINDSIHVEGKIRELRETKKPDRGVAIIDETVKNQRGEAVMTFEETHMMHRRVK